MPATSIGVLNAGNNSGDLVATWNCLVVASDGPATGLSLPIRTSQIYDGWKFELNVQSAQSAFPFGKLQYLTIAANMGFAYDDSGTGNSFYPGRVWIKIPSSNQVFAFSSKFPAVNTKPPATLIHVPLDAFNFAVKVPAISNPIIEIYMETDYANGIGDGLTSNTLNVSLFNYNLTED
jgi:hypothetical protein